MKPMAVAGLLFGVGLSGAEPPDFATRVQPMLVKAGCFSGACHGAGGRRGWGIPQCGKGTAGQHRRA